MSGFMEATVKIRGRSLDVSFFVTNVKTGRDGIGSYEFWGARGYDRGRVGLDSWKAAGITAYSERRDEYMTPSPKLTQAIEEYLYNDLGTAERILETDEADREAARLEAAERRSDERRGV